ncbi:MAG: endolytic transglycosylase MltG, partial [Bacteroidetes bacterium]|nr:endolytic transglycosylase MltG [Bacteroidota bacterium]
MAKKKKKKGSVISLILLAVIAFGGFWIYNILTETVQLKENKKYTYFYIKRSDTYNDVLRNLSKENIIEDSHDFDWLATKMGLDKQINIHAGRYRIINGMTMRQVINLIKYNKQENVKLHYIPQQIRDLEEFIEYTSQRLDIRAEDLDDYLKDEKKLADNFNLDPDNSFALLVTVTY